MTKITPQNPPSSALGTRFPPNLPVPSLSQDKILWGLMKEDLELKFGIELISGYLSAILGNTSLAGVLCFRFPSVLTSE